MNFTEALGLLLKATPDSVVSQLHELHKSIQSADRAELMAIYGTLSTIRAGFHEFDIATTQTKVSQIDAICTSAMSRMAILIEQEKKRDQQKLYEFFGAVTDYHPVLASMCAGLPVL